uniref:hypothetical protein n=1 Tax=Alistipes shahii TaxID=328814 RepID=UPI00307B0F58
ASSGAVRPQLLIFDFIGHFCTCSRVAQMGRTSSTTHLRRTSVKRKPAPLKSKIAWSRISVKFSFVIIEKKAYF